MSKWEQILNIAVTDIMMDLGKVMGRIVVNSLCLLVREVALLTTFVEYDSGISLGW